MNRILFESSELKNVSRIVLKGSDERARHIRRVLKLAPGSQFRSGVVNGPGATGTLLSSERSSVTVSLELHDAPLLPPYPVTLLLSHPRPIVLKRMLKDLTTLGVREMIIFNGERGETSYFESSLWEGDSYRRFLVDGAMQAGSTLIPEVRRLGHLRDALKEGVTAAGAESGPPGAEPGAPTVEPGPPGISKQALLIYPDEVAPEEKSLSLFLSRRGPLSAGEPAVIALGAERGWSDGERKLLDRAGFEAVSLGPRVLRTETASLVVTSMVVAKYHSGKRNGEAPR